MCAIILSHTLLLLWFESGRSRSPAGLIPHRRSGIYKFMEFKKITLDDIDLLRPYFPYAKGRTCDYSVGGVFIWRDFFRMEYCIEDNVLYSHLLAELKPTLAQVRFTTVPEPYLPMFQELCNIVFIAEQREYMDYLYSAEELANLSGRKFHGQKNLVNAFIRENPDWSFEAIGPENLPEVRAFFEADYQSDKDLPPSGLSDLYTGNHSADPRRPSLLLPAGICNGFA